MGDLAQCVDGTISESETKQITIDLLKGLAHIHEEGFVHRDLKPQVRCPFTSSSLIHNSAPAHSLTLYLCCRMFLFNNALQMRRGGA